MTGRPARTLRRHRLLVPAPSVGAVLVLLVGSVMPATPPPRPDAVRAAVVATAVPAPAVELPPASVTTVRELGAAPQRLAAATARNRRALLVSGSWWVPDVLLAAYRRAVAGAPPGCHLPVSLLAAIGQVESGSLAGRSLDAAHRVVPPVLGPVLDGVGTATIRDTDGGLLDGNRRWDRAVGPMQFIPGTWAAFGVDADGDGRADPQNVYDAAASAAGYLCEGGRDLALASGLQSAILAYNHSASYLATVIAWQRRFATAGTGTGHVAVDSGTGHAPNGTLNAPTSLAASATIGSSTVHLTRTRNAGSTTGGSTTGGSTTAGSTTGGSTTGGPSNDVLVRTAAKLAFTTAPSPTATGGTALTRQPVVTVQNAAGNTITTDTSPVTLTLTNPAGAALACAANPRKATSGVASFTGCKIDRTGTYTLTATDGSMASATSSRVTITAGAPAMVSVVSGSAESATVGEAFISPLVVRVTDTSANPVPVATVTFTAPAAGASGTFANVTGTTTAATGTTTAITGANGQATSNVFAANTTAGSYNLTATAGSVSATFTLANTPGAATKFVIASVPISGSASATASLGPITVQRQDSYGNPVPAPTGGTPVTLSSDSSGTAVFATTLTGTSVTSVTIPSGAPGANFYYGDTKAGSPLITASGPLASATQTEIITAAAVQAVPHRIRRP